MNLDIFSGLPRYVRLTVYTQTRKLLSERSEKKVLKLVCKKLNKVIYRPTIGILLCQEIWILLAQVPLCLNSIGLFCARIKLVVSCQRTEPYMI